MPLPAPPSFFFYCYLYLRDLHSFPTRRSSDLILRFKYIFTPNPNSYFRSYTPGILTSIILLIDRKSTRLNSSHVAISYAVFCLKKKNNIDALYFHLIYKKDEQKEDVLIA